MILNYLLKIGSENTGDYEEKINKRLKVTYVLGVLGIITFMIALILKNYIVNDFLRGFYVGIGIGLTGASVSLIIRFKKLLANKEKLQEKKIEENDERNVYIQIRTAYISFIVSLIVIYLIFIISGLFNLTVFLTLFVVLLFMITILILVYFRVKKAC